MASEGAGTYFRTADRADPGVVADQARRLRNQELLRQLYDAVSDVVLILNEQRQIVFFNQNLLDLLGAEEGDCFYGLRPGEALNCSHSCENRGGCGTAQACAACGAVSAILTAQNGSHDARECHVVRTDTGEAIDFLVRTSPLDLDGERFTICALNDISDQKRRRALERVFFHDLLNTATALKFMVSPLMADPDPKAAVERLKPVVLRLVDEIQEQRDIAAAENVALGANPRPIKSLAMLHNTQAVCAPIAENHGAAIHIGDDSANIVFHSDPTLVQRVLGNMVKNAIEAEGKGGVVAVRCDKDANGVRFSVSNPTPMPKQAQLQVFQRFFSTKGPGRGLGAYSMKILTERYLGGRVWFASTREGGTTFHAWYPVDFPPKD